MFDILYISIAVVYLILLGFVLKQGLKTAEKKYYFFFLLSLLFWHFTLYLYLFIPLGDWLLFVGRLNYAAGPLFTFGLLGFFYAFPRHTFTISKGTERAFWIWTIFLASISLGTDLIDKSETYVDGIGPVVELGEWILLYMVHMFAMPLLTLMLGLKKYVDLKGLARTKFSFSFWIFVPTMLAFVVTNGVLPLYGIFWQFVYSPIFLIPIAVSSAYAMYSYRFFDFPLQSLKAVRQLLVIGGYLATGILVYAFLSKSGYLGNSAFNFIIASLLSLFVWHKLEDYIPEFTSSEFKTFRYHLQNLQSQLFTTKAYEELRQHLEKTFLLQLHLQKAELMLVRDQKINVGIPQLIKDKFLKEVEKQHLTVLVAEEFSLQKHDTWKAELDQLGAEIAIPIYLDKQLTGILLLGPKSDKSAFSRDEIQQIVNVQQFIDICFINILLQSDIKDENDLMKKMIREKTDRLRKQNTQIKKILKQQSDFIAVTAHEFRTPLNVAILQLEDTLESFDHQSQVLEDMKVMEGSLDKLKYLTQNLFDVQQFDLEKVSLSPTTVAVKSYLSDIVWELTEVMKAKGIQLTFNCGIEPELTTEIDCTKMRQVLYNLITNAAHFTPAESSIDIDVQQKGKKLIISVIDHGSGVPDDIKEDIFDKFRTATASKGMGLGLGLYLCKKIVELHKGSISVDDTSGGGATFIVEIPL